MKVDFYVEFTELVSTIVYEFMNDKLEDFKPLGDHTAKMLYNNGCDILEGATAHKEVFVDKVFKYAIIFTTGVKGNSQNSLFDYIDYNGIKHLFIFLEPLKEAELDPGDPDNEYDIGNSNIFNDLCKLVRAFQASFYSTLSEDLNYTMADTIQRLNPYIIAAFILNVIRPIEPGDVDGSPIIYTDLKILLQNSDAFKKAVNGVRFDYYEKSV